MTEPNWAELWRELTMRNRRPDAASDHETERRREGRAAHFDESVKRKGEEHPDTLLNFVLDRLNPGDTVLDIGAGTGHFAIPLARAGYSVTAVEPSPSMAGFLLKNAAAEGLDNIRLVDARWEDVEVKPHNIAFCSHAMYGSPDLQGFAHKMEQSALDVCYMSMRLPSHDGVMRELCRRIHGQPYDSPNFLVGYNVLYEMGIYANVVIEPYVRCWTDDNLETAFLRARRHLRIRDNTEYDNMIREVLAQRLVFKDGQYHWPDGMRSAMAWWEPSH